MLLVGAGGLPPKLLKSNSTGGCRTSRGGPPPLILARQDQPAFEGAAPDGLRQLRLPAF
jgi:hypothetical protein